MLSADIMLKSSQKFFMFRFGASHHDESALYFCIFPSHRYARTLFRFLLPFLRAKIRLHKGPLIAGFNLQIPLESTSTSTFYPANTTDFDFIMESTLSSLLRR
jgi:hypothetical protein